MKIKELHHVGVQTGCYEESKKFYTEILGFKTIKETPNINGRAYNTWLKLGEIIIELQAAKLSADVKEWNSLNEQPTHISLLIEDFEDVYKEIKSKGYNSFKLKNGVEIYNGENGSFFKVKAPEGTVIEMRDSQKI